MFYSQNREKNTLSLMQNVIVVLCLIDILKVRSTSAK